MRISVDFGKLKMTTPREYISRFVFGGLVTMFATLIANRFGPVVGGLFLAFPGILPTGLTLTEKHVVEKKRAWEEAARVLGALKPALKQRAHRPDRWV